MMTARGGLGGQLAGLGRLTGWRRWLAAGLAGLGATLALPPADILPAILVTWPVLALLILDAPRARSAAAAGWWFGVGYFLAALYWIGAALLVEPAPYAWLLPAAVLVLPAGLALFWAAAGALAWVLTGRWRVMARARPAARAAMVAVVLLAAEAARGTLFTGFPWALPGYALAGYPIPLQGAAVVGVYGLTLVVLLAAFAPVAWLKSGRAHSVVGAAGLLAPLVVVALYGVQRLPERAEVAVTDTTVRLVQPAIAQAAKWDPALERRNLRRHLALTGDVTGEPFAARPATRAADAAQAESDADIVIWPEAATRREVAETPWLAQRLAARLQTGQTLLMGIIRDEAGAAGERRYFNALQAVSAEPRLMATYDKSHLVPFGEYVPFRDWLPLATLAQGLGDMTPGPGRQTQAPGDVPAYSPLICYEAIFPGQVVAADAPRPAWLVNVTNDAWYGRTAGPYQHLAQARVRAVEEGLPLMRAANTGISASIDPYGRGRTRLGLDRAGIVTDRLPAALAPTIFARLGNVAALLLALLVTAGALAASRRPAAHSTT